jgi:hypothetical protein
MLERSGFTVTKLVPIDKYINRSEKRPFFFILVHLKKRDEKVPVISGETSLIRNSLNFEIQVDIVFLIFYVI